MDSKNQIAASPASPDPRNDTGGLKAIWQWLTESNTRIVGVFLLGLAFVLLLGLMVLITSQKSTKSQPKVTIPQSIPTTQSSQDNIPPFPSPATDLTTAWTEVSNSNGFKIKYPAGSTLNPKLPQATESASLEITSGESTIVIEITDKKHSLKETVDLLREKNATSEILTKPISILFGGNEGYEWYLQSDGLAGINSTYKSALGKNRVIQFDKNNKHYLIFSSFNDAGEQLLSTFRLNP